MTVTAQEAERYVRERWEYVSYREPFVLIGESADEYDTHERIGWEDAYAFTVDRERRIAGVEAELSALERWTDIHSHDDMEARKRIIAAEQGRLTELKRGMAQEGEAHDER